MRLHPLFKQFGSKWSSAKLYPVPRFQTLVEPFAGGAGYALNHSERDVVLFDTDPNIADLWRWLIGEATQASILDIPINLPEGTDLREIGLSRGQALLCKHWQRTNNVGECWTVSVWGNKPGQWTANARARVAEEVSGVKHWRFGAPTVEPATWFIDPPYQANYAYRQPVLDFPRLGLECQKLPGQVIVCEGGESPNWLPFVPLAERVTSRRKASNNHHCKEWIWMNEN